jgi:hypothetical protein
MYKLFTKSSLSPKSSRRLRRPATRRPLSIDQLEDRTVPTILFIPQYGAERASNPDHNYVLGGGYPGVPLYPIFWGSYWATSAGQNFALQIEISMNTMFYGSPYLDGLHQYSPKYRAFAANSAFNYSDPSNGFSGDSLRGVVENAIDNQGLPESDDNNNEGIYVVLTPPGINSSDPNAGRRQLTSCAWPSGVTQGISGFTSISAPSSTTGHPQPGRRPLPVTGPRWRCGRTTPWTIATWAMP